MWHRRKLIYYRTDPFPIYITPQIITTYRVTLDTMVIRFLNDNLKVMGTKSWKPPLDLQG